jgi:hypothetical protein
MNESGTHLANGFAIILAEVRNRLVVRHQPAREPHHLNIAPSLTLQPTAGLNPIEITVKYNFSSTDG